MPVKFHCGCGATLIVSRRRIGMSIRCPKCEQPVTVPQPKKRAPPQPSPVLKTAPLSPPPRPPNPERPSVQSSEPAPPPVQAKSLEPIRSLEATNLTQRVPQPAPRTPTPPSLPSHPGKSAEEVPPLDLLEPHAAVIDEADRETDTEESEAAIRGYVPDRGKTSTVRLLAVALALAAICSTLPAVLDTVAHFRFADSPGVARWAYLLLLAGTVQLAYAIYLAQLPDWSTALVVSVVSLVVATCYAATLSLTLLAPADSGVISFLDLTDQRVNGRAAGWCFIMLCIASLLSYFSGRIGIRWRQKVGI
ncbi:MAG: hypothetical protein ACC628_25395 [Pirellulaceae bacterium]